MLDAQIIDFTLQVQGDFQHPRIRKDADPIGIATRLAESFGDVLDLQDVTFVSTDELFGYSLTVPMFKGAGDVVLNPQSLSVTFRTGRTRQALNFIIDAICKIYGFAVDQPIRQNRVSFNAVASFAESQSYDGFMKQFQNPEKGVTAGGIILFASGKTVAGEARLSIEKALGHEKGLFVSAFISTTEVMGADLFKKLNERFTELTQSQGLNLTLAA